MNPWAFFSSQREIIRRIVYFYALSFDFFALSRPYLHRRKTTAKFIISRSAGTNKTSRMILAQREEGRRRNECVRIRFLHFYILVLVVSRLFYYFLN